MADKFTSSWRIRSTAAVLFLLVGSLSWRDTVAQTTPCPSPNYVLRSQGGVNAFPAGCSEITGQLTIGPSSNITDLSPLAAVRIIGGSLNISNNAALTTLDALSGITSVGGDLWIMFNQALSNIDGLSQLRSIESVLIQSNAALTDIDGLASLTKMKTALLGDNPLLANIDGFSSVTSLHVGGSLGFAHNDALTNLNGLSGLTSIGGGLTIVSNAALTDLEGLSGIIFIGNLNISGNGSLAGLAGLSQVTTVGGYLTISDNEVLADVDGLSGVTSTYALDITGNTGLANLDGLSQIRSVGAYLNVADNDALQSCSCGLYTCVSSNCVKGGITMSGNATSGDCNNDGADLVVNECVGPTAVTLLLPLDESADVFNKPHFLWLRALGATSYRLQVSGDRDFLSIVFDDSALSSTAYTLLSPLAPGATYFWRVRANDLDVGDWSGVRSFTTSSGVASGPGEVRTEFTFDVPVSTDLKQPYATGLQQGARGLSGPHDLDGDGKVEVLVTDYTGGGRVHVIENEGIDSWALVYSTPWNDSTSNTGNARAVGGGDMDGDGKDEIYFFGGRGYSASNPNIDQLPVGLYVYEFTGIDNDFGTTPAAIYTFPDDTPDRWWQEFITVQDVDKDGKNEMVFANNGSDNRYDNWYVLSVEGDIGSGSEEWVVEARLSSRDDEEFDPVDRGGGSPFAMIPADLNGDGVVDFSMHSWSNFNLTNGTVAGPDSYTFPSAAAPDRYYQADPNRLDDYAVFGGVAVDIDGNGDDEVYYAVHHSPWIAILNYEEGEDILSVTPDNAIMQLIPDGGKLGITAGNVTGDETPEILETGLYSPDQVRQDYTFSYLRYARFMGGDVEVSSNYEMTMVDIAEDYDLDLFDWTVTDEDGYVAMSYTPDQTLDYPLSSKPVYLGDPDSDGKVEVALAFQGIHDSVTVALNYTSGKVSQESEAKMAVAVRSFLRIVEFPEPIGVAAEAPDLLSPEEGAVEVPAYVAFDWDDVPGAVAYHIQIASDNTFALDLQEDSVLVSSEYEIEAPLTYALSYSWRVRARNAKGWGPWSETHSFTVAVGTATEGESDIPTSFALHPAYPNPFNPSTTIRYDVPEATTIRLVVFDALGRIVESLVNSHQLLGRHTVTWDARGVPSGMYFVRMNAGKFTETRRVILTK